MVSRQELVPKALMYSGRKFVWDFWESLAEARRTSERNHCTRVWIMVEKILGEKSGSDDKEKPRCKIDVWGTLREDCDFFVSRAVWRTYGAQDCFRSSPSA